MSELPMSTVAIVVIFLVVAAIALIFVFSGFQNADTTGTFFNFSQNISANSSAIAGRESQIKPLFG